VECCPGGLVLEERGMKGFSTGGLFVAAEDAFLYATCDQAQGDWHS
jgi:hypothetical protein